MSYTDAQVYAAATAIDKHRAGDDGAALRDDMIRVAHRAGASLRQLAAVSGLNRKAVTAIVESDTSG